MNVEAFVFLGIVLLVGFLPPSGVGCASKSSGIHNTKRNPMPARHFRLLRIPSIYSPKRWRLNDRRYPPHAS